MKQLSVQRKTVGVCSSIYRNERMDLRTWWPQNSLDIKLRYLEKDHCCLSGNSDHIPGALEVTARECLSGQQMALWLNVKCE